MASSLYSEVLAVHQALYSRYAEEYEARTRQGHSNYLKPFIDQFIARLAGPEVLDLGCGPGRDLAYFKAQGLAARGLDCSPVMVALARGKGLEAEQDDFVSFPCAKGSLDGIWAYTSHTIIPKGDLALLLDKYRRILKPDTGVLALGMIEGQFEGWKEDGKYDGATRFVARFQPEELERLLAEAFGSVWIDRVPVGNKVYLHCLCAATEPARPGEAQAAARSLFDRFSDTYRTRTQSGIELLKEDRNFFIQALAGAGPHPRVLDVGCGPGRDALLFKEQGLVPVGLDISPANVAHCLQAGLDAVEGDFHDLAAIFGPDSFAGAWCNCSITNWVVKAELPRVLTQLKEVVRPGGILFVGSVLGSFSGWECDGKYAGLRRYNNHWREDELRAQLAVLGTLVHERKLTFTGNKDYLNLAYHHV